MKIAVISDIHSNLAALIAVAENISVTDIYCLGDVIGYGSSPNEVVEWIRDRVNVCLMGNHDYSVVTGEMSWFNSTARIAVEWTQLTLRKDNMIYLRKLPSKHRFEMEGLRVLLVHGSPEDNLFEYVYPDTHENLFEYYLEKHKADVIVVGHTHIPFIWESKKGIIFNPGSVGQPRSGNIDASYATLTLNSGKAEVEHKLIKYDVDLTARRILQSGLPESLANRLYQGI